MGCCGAVRFSAGQLVPVLIFVTQWIGCCGLRRCSQADHRCGVSSAIQQALTFSATCHAAAAAAGLGWLAVGVSGTAELKVWVPEGVSVTLHDALIPDYAKVWQKPGFSAMLPQAAKKAAGKKGGGKGGAGKAAPGSSGSGSDSE